MTRLYWVQGPWPGKLALSARPRGGDWLDDEVAGWRKEGISTVVSLLTPEEEQELSLELEASQVLGSGLSFVSLAIPDRQAPSTVTEMQSAIQGLDRTLSSGKNVLVHCRQGIGRSGLVAASLLVNRGWTPRLAMKELSDLRGTRVPETAEQEEWIERYAAKVIPQREPKVASR
jgi:protein-tyrosine phosphatase